MSSLGCCCWMRPGCSAGRWVLGSLMSHNQKKRLRLSCFPAGPQGTACHISLSPARPAHAGCSYRGWSSSVLPGAMGQPKQAPAPSGCPESPGQHEWAQEGQAEHGSKYELWFRQPWCPEGPQAPQGWGPHKSLSATATCGLCLQSPPFSVASPSPFMSGFWVLGHQDPKSCSQLLSRPGAGAKGFARGSAEGGR